MSVSLEIEFRSYDRLSNRAIIIMICLMPTFTHDTAVTSCAEHSAVRSLNIIASFLPFISKKISNRPCFSSLEFCSIYWLLRVGEPSRTSSRSVQFEDHNLGLTKVSGSAWQIRFSLLRSTE